MKHKKYSFGIITLLGLGVMNAAVATDYSSMSTEELMNMRSQIREMSAEDQNSYRNEMRSRVQSMSDEDKSSFQQSRGQGSGGGYGSGYGSRQGGGGKFRQ